MSKRTIAIIRGGPSDHLRSMKNGASVIISLSKYLDLIDVIDVSLDKDNNWFEKGVPSDPHKVFSKADFYIDFTNNKFSDYHNLSRKLNVKPIFQNDYSALLNRVNIKRILEQVQINTPKYTVIRDRNNLEYNLKTIWTKFHLPIVIKEASHDFNEKSINTYSFLEAFKKIKNILDKKGEALIEEHIHGKYISVAAIPNYRGEELYIPTPVEVLNVNILDENINSKSLQKKCLIGHDCEKRSLIFIDNSIKEKIKYLVKDLHKTLFLNNHTMIDMVLIENNINKEKKHILKVLDIHSSPNIFEDSRFDFILKNSGVDIGKFILDKIDEINEKEKIY